jgi:hypothetical protein
LALFCLLAFSSQSAQADPAAPEAIDVYQNATFKINYRTTGDPGTCEGPNDLLAWPGEAQAGMNHVVDIIDNLINSDITIEVDGCYKPAADADTLASAGANDSYTQNDDALLPVADVTYAVALANSIVKKDLNGAKAEIVTDINSNISWDFCTTGCTVADDKFDFVSTMVHEVLHGMGFAMTFGADENENPPIGFFSTFTGANPPPDITDTFVYSYDGTNTVTQLISIENDSNELYNTFTQGSGTVVFDSPNVKAANDENAAFIFSPQTWSGGSSMSHLDDKHATNLGRMMNAATPEGPSSRTIDAITLAFLKDIGWSVNEAMDLSDLSDGTTYPLAGHIASADMVNHIKLGETVNTESSPAANDSSDDGVTKIGTWTTGADGGTIQISVQVGTAGAKGCLNAWADWNNDNDFDDAGEQLFAMAPVDATSGPGSFDIPESVDPETPHTYRFRLHQDWDNDGTCDDQVGVSSTVRLMNGEVEDHIFPAGTAPVLDQLIYLPLVVR